MTCDSFRIGFTFQKTHPNSIISALIKLLPSSIRIDLLLHEMYLVGMDPVGLNPFSIRILRHGAYMSTGKLTRATDIGQNQSLKY
jgi:hypothetical protein